MKFDLKTTGLFCIQKNGHRVTTEATIYRNEEFSIFGITDIKTTQGMVWSIVHIPSERIIISKFETKEEVEEFCDFLAKAVDLNSLLLCNPKFELIKEQIKYDVEISYKKYRISKELKNCEKNNYF